jgi:hypothetical protein
LDNANVLKLAAVLFAAAAILLIGFSALGMGGIGRCAEGYCKGGKGKTCRNGSNIGK